MIPTCHLRRPVHMLRMTLVMLTWLWASAVASEVAPAQGALMLDRSQQGVAHLVVTDRVVPELAPGVVVPGLLHRRIWQIADATQTTLQMLDALIAQAEAEGLAERFRCATTLCGGFDFRLRAPLEPPPVMFINLADFQYAALSDGDERRWMTLLVSRSGPTLFVELTEIRAEGVAQPNLPPAAALVGDKLSDPPIETEQTAPATPSTPTTPGLTPDMVTQRLTAEGHVPLPGLRFASGSGALDSGGEASLAALAAYLKADPTRRIALVGHSDATGSYEVNRRISAARAEQVRQRMISAHDVNPAQLEAYGAAWLAPRSESRTEMGRAMNRRVEAVWLPPLPR